MPLLLFITLRSQDFNFTYCTLTSNAGNTENISINALLADAPPTF
jgi:hypothetical protein